MSWPLASHFSAVLQNPRIAFRDPELQQFRIEKDERNQPKPWSGAFAVVYKGISAKDGRAFAIRVFTTESPERRERYDRISEYLRTRKLGCLVDFEYRDRSIRSAGDGKWYPLILMDWVPGDTLFKWVRARALEEDRQALAAAAERWTGLVRELADARIAHGDLQHANVMVTESGELKLVDYDGMCVPSLVGRRNLEVGVEPYQHPGRGEQTLLSLELDNYSTLVIYVALRALAADPLLWRKYVEAPAHDKLLFRKEDFQTPASSSLYRDLKNSPDEDVRDLAERLFALARGRMEDVPRLGQVLDSFGKIERLLVAGQWDEAVQRLNRRGTFRDAPAHLKPLIQKAYEHVCRMQAWATFQKVPRVIDEVHDRALTRAWNETLFTGFEPAERRRAEVIEARKRVEILDQLQKLVAEDGAGTTIAREWAIYAASKQLPKKYPHRLRARVRKARHAFKAIRAIEQAVRLADDDAQIAAAWQQVVEEQCEALVNPEHRPRIELALRRLPLVQAFQALSPDLAPDHIDRRLLDLWQEDLLAGTPEAEIWRPAYRLAVERRELLERLEDAINRREEAAIVELASDPRLADYPLPPAWRPVVLAYQQRVAKTEALLAALGNADRRAFVAAFDARIIRQYAERFHSQETLLSQWTRSDILPLERIGLRPALGRASLVCLDKREDTFRVRWTWPQPRFAGECLLGICEHEPNAEDDPRDLELVLRVPIDRASWESAGGSRIVHLRRAWRDGYVVVWAAVDLGFRLFYSPPLVLGRPREAAGLGWRRWKPWKALSFSRRRGEATPMQPAETFSPPRLEDERG